MRRTDLETFRAVLKTKQGELSVKSRNLESIATERSPEMFEELQYKSDRELAIVGLTRDSAIGRKIELALIRIRDDSFGICVYCEQEISRRRLEAGRRSVSAARKPRIAAMRTFSRVSSRYFSMRHRLFIRVPVRRAGEAISIPPPNGVSAHAPSVGARTT